MYAGLQSVWWAGTYVICYRYQPTVLIRRTGWGSRAVHWVGGWLQRVGTRLRVFEVGIRVGAFALAPP